MGEKQGSRLLCFRDVRCAATLTPGKRAILGLVLGAVVVEAGVVAVRLAFAAGATSLLSLPAAATVAMLAPLATFSLGP